MAYNVYSLPDVKSVLYHPDVGTANLHLCGIGKITVSAAGDLSSHTTTADGYVVVNRLKTTNGTIQIEVPQNSPEKMGKVGKEHGQPEPDRPGNADDLGQRVRIQDGVHRRLPAEDARPDL